jgi:hypothetical protein
MEIIDNGAGDCNSIHDSGNVYTGHIGIEIRGASSSGYPQKPYSLETRDSLGDNLNVPLLGMPAENDWLLISTTTRRLSCATLSPLTCFARWGIIRYVSAWWM